MVQWGDGGLGRWLHPVRHLQRDESLSNESTRCRRTRVVASVALMLWYVLRILMAMREDRLKHFSFINSSHANFMQPRDDSQGSSREVFSWFFREV